MRDKVVRVVKRFDTSEQTTLPIDYGRRTLVRLGDDASVRIVVERWRASVRRLGKAVLND